MKKVLAMVLALALLLPACALGENVVKIGIYEPASGDNGAGGKQETLGMYYANSVVPTVEIDGEEYKIELVEVDNQSSTDKAPSAAQSLVSAGVSIVLGTYGSSCAIAAADIFDAAGIVAIGASCTNPQVTLGNPLYYRICYLDPFQGTVNANYAAEQYGAKTAYVLTQLGNDYDAGLGNYFTEAFEALGGKVISETFLEGNSDFSAYITNAVNAGADVIFMPTSTTYASLMLGQAAAAGVKIPFLAGDTWASSVILEAVQGSELTVCVTDFFDEHDASAVDFVEGFKAWLNADSQNLTNNGGNDVIAAVSALGYDDYMVAVEAIKAAGSVDPEDIADVMADVTYTGVTGAIAFDENGDAIRDQAFIKQAKTDELAWEFVKVQGVAE